VDDDAMLRLTMPERLFKERGVAFDLACNGKEAVEMALSREYALIIIDNMMPVQTGREAVRELRAVGYTSMVVGMTGDPSGCADRDDFEAAGLNACVSKDTAGVHRLSGIIDSLADEFSTRAGVHGDGNESGAHAAGSRGATDTPSWTADARLRVAACPSALAQSSASAPPAVDSNANGDAGAVLV